MDWTEIPHLKEVIKMQCLYANVDFEDIDFDKPDWFSIYSWSRSQEDQFKSWVINYLKNNIKARRQLMAMPMIKTNRMLNRWFQHYNLMYGFRRSDHE